MKIGLVVLCVGLLAQVQASAYSLFLTCNESSGRVAQDASTNRFNFQVNGASWAPGIRNNGLFLDGQDDFLTATNPLCLDTVGRYTTGTIAVSFRLNSLPLNTSYPVCYFGKTTGSSVIIEVGHRNQESKLYFTLITNGIPLCFDSNINLATNIWYRFAVVVGTDFNTGYLNGVELTNRHYNYGNARSSFFLANVEQEVFWLGKGFSASTEPTFFDGEIDEFRVSPRAFDFQEVASAYKAIVSVWPISLQAQSPFGLLLRWPSQGSERFNVRYRMSLEGVAPWLVLASNLPASQGETIYLHQNGSNSSSGFYRVTRND